MPLKFDIRVCLSSSWYDYFKHMTLLQVAIIHNHMDTQYTQSFRCSDLVKTYEG